MDWISLDQITKFIASVAPGGLAGLFGGGAANIWRSRLDRQKKLDETRAARLVQWRSELRDPKNRMRGIVHVPSWSEIRTILPAKLLAEAERAVQVGGPAMVVMPNHSVVQMGSPRNHPWDDVLDRLAELERTWKLI